MGRGPARGRWTRRGRGAVPRGLGHAGTERPSLSGAPPRRRARGARPAFREGGGPSRRCAASGSRARPWGRHFTGRAVRGPTIRAMHPRLAEIAATREETRAAVVRAVEHLSPEDAARRPGPEAWSVDEILTHLSLVEPGVAKRIAKSVRLAREAGLARETSDASVLGSLDGAAFETLRVKQ